MDRVLSNHRAALQAAADDAARAGRVFAAQLCAFAETYGVSGPAFSTALAVAFASLLVDLNDRPHDEARLDLFGDQVRAAAAAMRTDWDSQGRN